MLPMLKWAITQVFVRAAMSSRPTTIRSVWATNALSFRPDVPAGEGSADLDYSSPAALSQNGGSIRNLASSPATPTLPAPGAAGSLGAAENLVVAEPTNLTIGSCGCTGLEGLALLAALRVLAGGKRRRPQISPRSASSRFA